MSFRPDILISERKRQFLAKRAHSTVGWGQSVTMCSQLKVFVIPAEGPQDDTTCAASWKSMIWVISRKDPDTTCILSVQLWHFCWFFFFLAASLNREQSKKLKTLHKKETLTFWKWWFCWLLVRVWLMCYRRKLWKTGSKQSFST